MRDQIALAKRTGELCVAIPLYRQHEMYDSNVGYKIKLVTVEERPLAYVIDIGAGTPRLCNAKIAEKYLEFIGDL